MARSRSPGRSSRDYGRLSRDAYSSRNYRDRERERDRDYDRDRERPSRYDRYSNDRDYYRDRDYDRDYYRDRDRGRDRDRDRDSDRDRGRDRERERERNKEHPRDYANSSRISRSKSPPNSVLLPVTNSPAPPSSLPSIPPTPSSNSIPVSSTPPATSPSVASGGSTPDSSTQKLAVAEEKKRQRMERLAQWKAQKAKEQKLKESTPENTLETPSAVSSVPNSSFNSPGPQTSSSSSSSKESIKKQGISKMFNDSDSSNVFEKRKINVLSLNKISKPVMKPKIDFDKPKEAPPKSIKDEDDDVDPLDAFMSTIQEDKTSVSSLPTSVMDDELNDDGDPATGDADEEMVNPEDILAQLEKKKRKDIPTVDHSKINYEPFRKQFYFELPEISSLSSEEVDMMRLELDGIKVRGSKCPAPVFKWSQFGLPVPVMEVINNLGFEKPTSIQAQSLPAIMSGRDVIGVAKTGSGKTMAFLLPLFRHIKDQRPLAKHEGPMALVMTPTRELAVQIFRECKPFLRALNLRAVCAYGGSPIKDQIADLKRGAEIIVCTPGRMIDLLAANSGRVTNLQRVTYLVLDEADRMFDMGFEPQIMKIINNIRPDRQTVLFSATFPRQMEILARKTLSKAIEIIVGARSVVAPEIKQIVEVRPESTKFVRLLEILGDFYSDSSQDARALIFVDRQEAADALLKDLLIRGYPSLSIHGGKEQIDRDSALSDFRKGVVNLLIATSVAARGLDVKQLRLVVNYDAPNHMEDYVHRVGRTGRAGNTGTAVTFVTPEEDRAAANIVKALKLSNAEVPTELQAMADVFMAKVKAGEAKFGSGFRGKGLEKLDEARDTARKRERKAFGEDEGDEENETSRAETVAAVTTAATTQAHGFNIGAVIVNKGHHASTEEKMRKQQVLKVGAAPDNRGPETSEFHATLEINDFPQKARWAVTNNANICKIIEETSTSITTKGIFYPAGKSPAEGEEPKLYILIEGQSDVSVSNAHKALVDLLVSGIEQAKNTETRGRYTV
ncbi:uncharacterized protein SAPINGB_P004520 [Magnusiomyces paraingens]|uniref:RNA helicase n=1 Tax=Magnusiomyces paraingens TaxID=2606893 RepID=A0A5E8C2D6_9ASCO|nr:uncharacterized protein SAPINGB_P004520 [Saprochaete ingens]VVT55285.1 unnamed protein product [Saprochaete ingens]